jgi:uncharacterized protein YkwD
MQSPHFIVWFLIAPLVAVSAQDAAPAQPPAPRPVTTSVSVSHSAARTAADAEAERQLFDMANEERAKAGLAPLQMDAGLTQAAREHAAALAAGKQLSHQFPGEAPLTERLAASTELHLERGGENVASAPSVDQVHESLMLSPPHRENLLNAAYNMAGFGVVRSGHTLYVTQDFAEGGDVVSRPLTEEKLGASLAHLRIQHNLPALQRVQDKSLETLACAMADADSLRAQFPRDLAPGRYLLRYTTPEPQIFSASVAGAAADRSVHAFAVSSCYAHSATYPNGTYWVLLVLY